MFDFENNKVKCPWYEQDSCLGGFTGSDESDCIDEYTSCIESECPIIFWFKIMEKK